MALLIICLTILALSYGAFYSSRLIDRLRFYKDHYHQHDDIKVSREDLIPYEFRTYNLKIFNVMITIKRQSLKDEYAQFRQTYSPFSIIHLKREEA